MIPREIPGAAVGQAAQARRAPLASVRTLAPGTALAVALALVAVALGSRVPILGAPVIAVVLGVLLRQWYGMPRLLAPGVRFSSKQVLQAAIVILGTSLSMRQIWITGSSSLLVMLGTLIVGLTGIQLLGRLLQIEVTLSRLIAVGTGICGASAIGALAPIVAADEAAIAYAISTIFLFNVTAVVTFPPLGHLLGLSQHGFGLWAGTAVNDTSSVVAAAYSFGTTAGAYAVVVKLTRTVMIVPVSLIFAWLVSRERRASNNEEVSARRPRLPLFIAFFLLASAANTIGLFAWLSPALSHALGQFLIAVALAGVGLSADFRSMMRTGPRPLLLGFSGWILLAVTSLVLQRLSGHL